MRLRTSLLLAVALALVGWMGGWFAADLWRRSPWARADRGSVQVREVSKTPVEKTETPKPVAQPRSPDAPIALPPLATPVRDVIVQLKQTADAGNVSASCRIAMELMRCRHARQDASLLERDRRLLRTLKPGTNEFMAQRDHVERRAKSSADNVKACTGVDDKAMGTAWRYLLRAAQGGHMESMSLFLAAPPLPESAVQDIEGYTAYRDFAPFFFESALRAGDVRAAYTAYHQYGSDQVVGNVKFYDRDPQKALTLAYLLVPLMDMAGADAMRAEMRIFEGEPGVDTARAIRDAEKMRRERFASSSPMGNPTSFSEPLPASCNTAD